MNTALLVVDVQNDYFPGGRMELSGSVEAAGAIAVLQKAFREKLRPIIHIQHIALKPGAAFFLPGTLGAEFYDAVKPADGEKIVVKNFPNSFRDTGLGEYLKNQGITRLIVAGMMTHLCIDTTVRAAFDLGFECIVAGDCCATRDLKINESNVAAKDVQNAFLAALNGTFARIMSADEAVQSMY